MGSSQFCIIREGKSANEAFSMAVEEAQYDYGHAGYTGTIAEKDRFVKIDVPNGVDPDLYISLVLGEVAIPDNLPYQAALKRASALIDDKWGPAGCVELSKGKFCFFGWASS